MSENLAATPARPLVLRIASWLAAVAVVALLVVLAVHVMISPITPDQPAPTGHFGEPCWSCHFIAEGVDVISVD